MPAGAIGKYDPKLELPEEEEQPKKRWVGSLITGIVALIGTGISAGGASVAEAEAARERKRLEKLGQERWEEEQKLAERERGMATIKQLGEERMMHKQQARTRSFNKDFLRAAIMRQPGPGTTTLGGI